MVTSTVSPPAPPLPGSGPLLTDERLVALAHAGNERAFSTLFERHRAPLSRYCRSILRDADDARDAFQNAMLAAYRAIEEDPPTGRVRPWLYRIAHNESISLLRRRREHDELSEQDGGEIAGVESDALAREQLRTLLDDLRGLPDRQRGAILMRELSGLEYGEIATAFGISSGAARQAVFEARSALADLAVGRDEDCDAIRAAISDGDRRVLRGRRVRSHLHACSPCRDFERAIAQRRRSFALVPALPALTVGTAITGGGIGAGAGAPAIVVASSAAAGGVPVVAKGVLATVALVAAGVGAAAVKTAPQPVAVARAARPAVTARRTAPAVRRVAVRAHAAAPRHAAGRRVTARESARSREVMIAAGAVRPVAPPPPAQTAPVVAPAADPAPAVAPAPAPAPAPTHTATFHLPSAQTVVQTWFAGFQHHLSAGGSTGGAGSPIELSSSLLAQAQQSLAQAFGSARLPIPTQSSLQSLLTSAFSRFAVPQATAAATPAQSAPAPVSPTSFASLLSGMFDGLRR